MITSPLKQYFLGKIFLLLSLLICFQVSAESEKQMVRIGLLSFDGADQTVNRWQPTVDYLNTQLPDYFFTIVPVDIKSLNYLVANNLVDYTLTNGVQFLKYKYSFKAVKMLNLEPIQGNAKYAIGSVLVGRSSTPEIASWHALKDKTILSTTENAFGGYRVLLREMLADSLTSHDLNIQFVGFPQRQLFTKVLKKEADFAILPTCLLERAISDGVIKQGELKVFMKQDTPDFACQTSSRLYPNWTLARTSKVKSRDAKKLAAVLLSINSDSSMAKTGRYNSWITPVDDSSIYQLMNDLGEDVSPSSLAQLWQTYKGLFLIIMAFCLAFLAFHLRVNYLVKLRSAQLRSEIDDHKLTAEKLAAETKQLFKAQRILLSGEMASGIAHELNQPLMAIMTYSSSCRRRLAKDPKAIDDIQHGLMRIEEQTHTATEIIKRMRNFMKVHEVKSGEYKVPNLIENVITSFRHVFKKHNIDCQVQVQDCTVMIDPVLAQQVLTNVIQNSIEAINATDTERGKIEIFSEEANNKLYLNIKDNGIGMTSKQLENVFMPFNSSKPNGLGLGMVICKRIVEMNQGTIEVQSLQPLSNGCLIQITYPLSFSARKSE